MNKYTVVYCGPRLDSYNSRITYYKHIEGKTFKEAVESTEDFDWTSIYFVFAGHCQVVSE